MSSSGVRSRHEVLSVFFQPVVELDKIGANAGEFIDKSFPYRRLVQDLLISNHDDSFPDFRYRHRISSSLQFCHSCVGPPDSVINLFATDCKNIQSPLCKCILLRTFCVSSCTAKFVGAVATITPSVF